jgi:hypothetical protein
MSAPRLQLKQSTGWFAAGREFAQALTLLSDGAFKLYVHVCLSADRRSGRLRVTLNHLARATKKTPEAVAGDLDELEKRTVCSMTRDDQGNPVLEVCDRFWPYQKQHPPSAALQGETEFVAKVRALFLAPTCVRASFSAADEKMAVNLYRRGVSLEQISRAILLGSARKYVSMLNAGVRTPIASFEYFADVINEVIRSPIPESYWEPLRAKAARMEQQWQQAQP